MKKLVMITFAVLAFASPTRAGEAFMKGIAGMVIVQEHCNSITVHPKVKMLVQSVRQSSPQQFQEAYDSMMSQAKQTIEEGMPESAYWPMWCVLVEPAVKQLHKDAASLIN
jgi:hypothetical protein